MAEKRNNDEFLSTARRRFAEAVEAERQIREEAREDLRFVDGDQWDPQVKAERERQRRPALTHNRLRSFGLHVANECRQNKPQIRFSPVEGADEDTAELLTGLSRHIQYDSQASVAYELSSEHQVFGSFGFFGLMSEYCGPDSFDQELKIRAFPDPMAVYGVLVPAIRRQKCRYAFVVDTMSREEHKAQFGESEAFASFAQDDSQGWVTDSDVRIAEYWTLETREKKIALLADGSIVDASQVPEGMPVERTRTVQEDVVRFCKLTGAEVIPGTETEWVGSTIPIFAVLGNALIVDGEPRVYSLVRFMRDPQKLINFAKSRIAESLATSPISPFVALEGSLAGREQEWATANTTMRPFLQYRAVKLPDGTWTVAKPERQVFEPPIQALSVFLAQEIDELKAISGIYDASIGNKSNETSGVALARRQQQSDITNMHFSDNLGRAHEQCGRAIAEAVPRLYDTARMVRILGEDESQTVVGVNQLWQDPATGESRVYDLSAGKYDVTVTMGRAFSTKRIETFDALSQLVQANPQLMQIIGDLIFRNSDFAGGQELAERFKKLLPPNLAEPEPKQAEVPEQVRQQLEQMGQMIDQLTNELNAAAEDARTQKAQLESKERIEAARLELQREELRAKIVLEQSKLSSQEAIVELQSELDMVKAQIARIDAPLAEETPAEEPPMMA